MATRARFKLMPQTPGDFATPLKARTEALRALSVWQARERGRRFRIVELNDDCLMTQLTWSVTDANASADLSASCETRHLNQIQISDP